MRFEQFTAAHIDLSSADFSSVTSIVLDTFTVDDKNLALGSGQTVTIENATGANKDINFTKAVNPALIVKDSGDATNAIDLDLDEDTLTAIDITESGSTQSFLNINDADGKLTSVTLDVSKALTLEDVGGATSVAAGGSTGDITLTANANKQDVTTGAGADVVTVGITNAAAKEFSVDLGSGDDKVVFANLDAANTFADDKTAVKGGAGVDTFAGDDALISGLGALSTADFAKKGIEGFEKVELTTAYADGGTTNLGNFGVNHVILTADSGDDHTVSGVTSGVTIEFGKSVDVIGDSSTTAGDELVVSLKEPGGSDDVVNVVTKNTTSDGNFDLKLSEVETLNITASDSDQTKNTFDLDAAQLETINITNTGASDVVIDLSGTNNAATAVQTVDASGATSTGGVTFTADSNAISGITYTGSAGGDDFTGTSLSDVVVGGSGDDKFDLAGGAANTVDLSAGGSDEVEFNSSTGKVTITGFTDGDVIDIQKDAGDDGETATTAQVGTAIDLTDATTGIVTLNASTTSITAAGSETVDDFTDTTDVAAYLEEGYGVEDTENFTMILNDGTDSYVYQIDVDAVDAATGGTANTIEAGDVTLVGVVEDHILDAANVAQT